MNFAVALSRSLAMSVFDLLLTRDLSASHHGPDRFVALIALSSISNRWVPLFIHLAQCGRRDTWSTLDLNNAYLSRILAEVPRWPSPKNDTFDSL